MGALRVGRGLGRGVHATRTVTVRTHEWQPDHPSHFSHELHADLDDQQLWATGGSSASSQLGRDDELAALVARVETLEGIVERVTKVAEAALALANAAKTPLRAGADTYLVPQPPSTLATAATSDEQLSPSASAESFPTERAHASSVTGMACGMPGAHEPPAVTRRRLPPAPSPGQHAPAAAPAAGVDSPAPAGADGHSPLHWEIRRFVDANDELVRRQAQLRQYAIDLLAHDVRSAWPCAQLRLYGSLATGLCSPASDIDVALVHAPPASAPQLLLALHALLQGRPHVAGAQLLPHAQVPILKLKLLVAAADGHLALVDFDVSVCAGSDEHHPGLAAVGPLRASLRELPALRALTICVKHYLAVLGLHQTYTGGLCAHAVLLLTRAYLLEQARGARASEAAAADAAWASAQEADPDLGEALLSLLAHYARFDFAHTHVCWAELASAEPVFQQRPPLAAARGYPPPPTMIDAVQNAAINVGAKAFAIATVSQAFARAADELGGCTPLVAPGVFFSLLRLGSGAGSGVLMPPPPPPPPSAARRLLLGAPPPPQPQPQAAAAAAAAAAPPLALKAASAPDATPAFALRAVPLPVEAYPPPADEGCAPEAEVAAGGVNVDEAARPQAAVAARPQAAVAARPQASVAAETPCAAAAHVSAAAPDAAAAAPSADGAAALAATEGMGAAEGAEGVAAVAAATRTGRKPRKRNNNGGGETARAGAADGASAEGSLAEWQALHEGLVTCVRERLDALVVSSAERERVHCAEHRAIKQVVEKQLRSANHLEEVLREQAGRITREVCRCSREFIDMRLEQLHRTMLAAHAASAAAELQIDAPPQRVEAPVD